MNYIISTEGTYYATQEVPRKMQCRTGLAGGEACIAIYFPKDRKAELCGRALITQSGSYDHCPTRDASDVQNIISPSCPDLNGRTLVVTGSDLKLAMTCNGQRHEDVVIKSGTTPLDAGCKVENLRARVRNEWSFNTPQEVGQLMPQQYVPNDNSIILGLSLKDVIIITLVSFSTLLSLGIGLLCYFKHRKQAPNHLEAYEQALRRRRRQYQAVNANEFPLARV